MSTNQINKILVTFPGKMGDLIYTLPAIMSLREHFDCEIDYQTSEYCRPAVSLIKSQPCVEDCFIDPDYILENFYYGCQPPMMSEPPGYDKVIHFGFKKELLGDVHTSHLIKVPYITLEKGYDLKLPGNTDDEYLFLAGKDQKDYIVLIGFGETMRFQFRRWQHWGYRRFWRKIARRIEGELIIIARPNEEYFYRGFGGEIICPRDLMETANIINNAGCFIGGQSVGAAIADGLKTPRLILNYFSSSSPVGRNSDVFSLDDSTDTILNKLRVLQESA